MDNNEKKLGFLVSIFIAILIGVILLQTIGDEVSKLDALGNSSNESITQINDTFVKLEHKYIHTWYELRAYNSTVIPTDDYDVNERAGEINISSELAGDGWGENITFYTDYLYYPNALGFEPSNTAALTLTKLLVLFFALAILGIGLMFVVPAFKEFIF